MPHSQEDMIAFGRDLAAAAQQRGVTLTNADADAIYQQVVARDEFHPLGVQNALASFAAQRPDPDAFDYGDDFDYEGEPEPEHKVSDLVAEFIEPALNNAAREIGRPLTIREQEALRTTAQAQADRGRLDEAEIIRDSGVKSFDEMSRVEQARMMAERVTDQQPDPNADREFDLANMTRNDWDTYMTMRVQGDEFDDVYEDED